MKSYLSILSAASVLTLAIALPAAAREYPVGGPVHAHDMEIAANYLLDIDMMPMTSDMAMGKDTIHLETDVHATADNQWGFPDGAWVPYLKVDYTLTKKGSIRDGVPASAIDVHGYGEAHPLVPTGPNTREPQNRRVEIILH